MNVGVVAKRATQERTVRTYYQASKWVISKQIFGQ